VLAVFLAANGLALGSLYALVAVGFSLIFGITKVFHVAHGAVYLLVAYTYIQLSSVSIPLAIIASLVVAAALGWLMNLAIYRPVQRARESFFTVFVASFGLTVLLSNLAALAFGSDVKTPDGGLSAPVALGAIQMPAAELIGIGAAIVLFVGLRMVLQHTAMGVGLRAVADDPALVMSVGLSSRRYTTVAFVLGSVLVVPAAVLMPYVQGVTPSVALNITTLALVATIVGGVGNLLGAAVAAFIFGIVQSMSTLFLDAAWQEAVAYAVLLLILMFRPGGLMTHKTA